MLTYEEYHELMLKRLSKNWRRDWEIMRDRADGQSLNQIAAAKGISRERVRQIEMKMIARMCSLGG
jgi:DNA-directed RNA polymerase sigma subunit (sigma70/sigma32)